MIKVLLADDQSLVRAGFRMILKAEPDIEVVGEAADGREAVAKVSTHRNRPGPLALMVLLFGVGATSLLFLVGRTNVRHTEHFALSHFGFSGAG